MKKLFLPLLLGTLALGFSGCSDDNQPMDSRKIAELLITFDPNPVTRIDDDTGQEEFICVYNITIAELNNVAVNLTEIVIIGSDLSTGESIAETKDVEFIISVFGTNRIRAGNSISSQFTSSFTLLDDSAIVEVGFTVRGTDDNTNEISTSSAVQCQP